MTRSKPYNVCAVSCASVTPSVIMRGRVPEPCG
jgi:hypothetical protein